MSWEATAWAVRQKVGPPARKLLLLVLANYADADGICWPSQGRLADDTGMSLDTVQRQTRKLISDGFLAITRPPKRRGQWQTFVYRLSMTDKEGKRVSSGASSEQPEPNLAVEPGRSARPQNAAWSEAAGGAVANVPVAPSDGDECGPARPHPARKPGRTAMRPKPSIEPPIEPSRSNISASAAERLRAFQGEQEATEVIQNRIAQRIGSDGWLMLGEMSDGERARLTTLQRRNQLNDALLASAVASARLVRPPP
ncbi:helix-turn-helix domain-containing protein [Bradyrhizobium sp. LA2.1]|uniref:helix-turn-helix domain-containing protein n=1 Tax=Bradyrhizobium sp. LA2.1 TaxID=3156376 RepID=UPI00339358D3